MAILHADKWHIEAYPDKDGHLKIFIKHEDGTEILTCDTDLGQPGEWVERFTTQAIENKYIISHLFTVKDKYTGGFYLWTLDQILAEINQNRSGPWIDYNESDWEEGWDNWCEGGTYTLIK